MNEINIWRSYKLFDDKLLLDMPYEYVLKDKLGNQYIYINSNKKGLVVSALSGVSDSKRFLLSMFSGIKKIYEDISDPLIMKRMWLGAEQRMMQITANDKNVLYVFLDGGEQQYLMEFTYGGPCELEWKKESEYILNTIRIIREEKTSGN